MRTLDAFPCVILLFTLCVDRLAAQTVSGRVIDGDTNTQIAAAEIMIVQIDSSSRTISDANGAFRVRAAPGIWTLRVKALGYDDLVTPPLQIEKSEHLSVIVTLTAKPLEIAPITVVARSNRRLSALDDFHNRARRNAFGYFMDQKAIEKYPVFQVSDLLRRAPGAWVYNNRVSFRGCYDARYLIDGMPVYGVSARSDGDPGMTATEWVNSIVSPNDVAAIEIYRGEPIPAELMAPILTSGDNSCGLIAIWTKR